MPELSIKTPEYLAEVRARENVKNLAFRLHAYCAAPWPSDFDFGYVEEDIRETIVLCAINLRRLIEIAGLRQQLPAFESKTSKRGEWASDENSFWSIVNALPHLQRLKCVVDFSSGEHFVKELVANTDHKNLFFEPLGFVRVALEILQSPQTQYTIKASQNLEV